MPIDVLVFIEYLIKSMMELRYFSTSLKRIFLFFILPIGRCPQECHDPNFDHNLNNSDNKSHENSLIGHSYYLNNINHNSKSDEYIKLQIY